MNVCDRCIQIYCVNTNINNTVRPIHKKNSIPPQVDKFELISVKWLFHSFLSESYSFIQVLFTTFFCQNQATIGTTLQSFDKSCSYRDVIGRGRKGRKSNKMEICTDLKNDHFDFHIPGLHTTAKTDRLVSVDQFKITLYKMCICRNVQCLIDTTTLGYCTFICLVFYNWNVYSRDIDQRNISSMHHDI